MAKFTYRPKLITIFQEVTISQKIKLGNTTNNKLPLNKFLDTSFSARYASYIIKPHKELLNSTNATKIEHLILSQKETILKSERYHFNQTGSIQTDPKTCYYQQKVGPPLNMMISMCWYDIKYQILRLNIYGYAPK